MGSRARPRWTSEEHPAQRVQDDARSPENLGRWKGSPGVALPDPRRVSSAITRGPRGPYALRSRLSIVVTIAALSPWLDPERIWAQRDLTGAAAVVIQPNDVLFGERIPVLHFDEDERVIACVLDTARRLTPHVDRMTSLDRDVLAVECDHPLPCRYEPMLGPMFVTLMERRGPKWLPGASPFVLLRWCRRGDLNPHVPQRTLGPQPSASTKFRHSDEACSAAREPTTSSDRAPGWILSASHATDAPLPSLHDLGLPDARFEPIQGVALHGWPRGRGELCPVVDGSRSGRDLPHMWTTG